MIEKEREENRIAEDRERVGKIRILVYVSKVDCSRAKAFSRTEHEHFNSIQSQSNRFSSRLALASFLPPICDALAASIPPLPHLFCPFISKELLKSP